MARPPLTDAAHFRPSLASARTARRISKRLFHIYRLIQCIDPTHAGLRAS